jgi:hypothetical protein
MKIKAIAPPTPLVSVGCDPELFILRNGRPISAIPIFEGSKGDEKPLITYTNEVVGGVIHDNVAVEFTMPPCLDAGDFRKAVSDCRSAIYRRLNEHARDLAVNPGEFVLSTSGSFVIADEELKHEDARTFGCSEDYNAWRGGMVNKKPRVNVVGNLRAAGGHVHVGFLRDKSEKLAEFLSDDWGKVQFVQLLDMSLGQVIAGIEAQREDKLTFIRRRSMYGAAGCYRPKEYGVEYRSPSSVWLETPPYAKTVFNTVQALAGLVNDTKAPEKLVDDLMEYAEVDEPQVIASINQCRPIKKLLDVFWQGG